MILILITNLKKSLNYIILINYRLITNLHFCLKKNKIYIAEIINKIYNSKY